MEQKLSLFAISYSYKSYKSMDFFCLRKFQLHFSKKVKIYCLRVKQKLYTNFNKNIKLKKLFV